MDPRALTLALRLLTTSCAGVALGAMTGCPLLFGCPDDVGWQTPEVWTTMTSKDLLGMTSLSDFEDETAWDHLLVGAEGTIVVLGTEFDESSATKFANVSQFGTQALRDAVQLGSEWWVVGDGGIAAFSTDRGVNWINMPFSTTSSFRAIVELDGRLVIVGDGVVLVRTEGAWAEIPVPGGGTWGQLRGAAVHGGRLYAVGLGGVAWSTEDPSGEWIAESLGTSEDLLGVGDDPDSSRVVAVGVGGAVIARDDASGTWAALDIGETGDVIAWSSGAALMRDGRILEVDESGGTKEFGRDEGARALEYSPLSQAAIAGEGGLFTTRGYFDCVGG